MTWEPRINTNEHELILKEEVYAIVGAATSPMNWERVFWSLNYPKATNKPVGVPLCFGSPKLERKRMVFNQSNIGVHSRPFAVKKGRQG
jgi:hypothetical protein